MIPCVSLTETSVLGNMKERVKEMRVFGCRLNFWNNLTATIETEKGSCYIYVLLLIYYVFFSKQKGFYMYKHGFFYLFPKNISKIKN